MAPWILSSAKPESRGVLLQLPQNLPRASLQISPEGGALSCWAPGG